MQLWTEEQVRAVAPDAAGFAAGARLAVPAPWSDTGSSGTLLWGKCQGSGKSPYQVSIDLTAPAYRCSCPSRKFPCKHAVALLLLWSRGTVTAEGIPAEFAQEWAETRAARAEPRTAAEMTKPADPVAQQKRQEERIARMDAGIDDFGRWLTDLVRGGLAAARSRDHSWWDGAAARLVDAQLPGIAERVRDLSSAVFADEDWADRLLSALGRWWSIVHAWRSREALSPAELAEVRIAVGWPYPTAEIRAGERTEGVWQVLGAHRALVGRLQQQRTWLRDDGGRIALELQTAAPGEAFGAPQLVGGRFHAAAAWYPGAEPRRVLFAERASAGTLPPLSAIGGGTTVMAVLNARAKSLEIAPWRDRWPAVLGDIRFARSAGSLLAVDAEGHALRLVPEAAQTALLAVSGGHPCELFGEIEGERLRPLTIAVDGEVIAL